MAQRERIRQKFPIFFAFGDHHVFLDTEQAVAATPEQRIRSIWPFLVNRVLEFQRTLKPRERVNFDPEDTLAELYTLLFEKDDKWEPTRGKYITYAGALIEHELCTIRDKSRTVHSPRNSSCRLKEYERIEASGAMSERRRRTAEQVRRTVGSVQSLVTREPGIEALDPASEVEARDADEHEVGLLRMAIRKRLNSYESAVIARSAGLWGITPQTIAEIAEATGREPNEVKRAKARAYQKIRDFIRQYAPSLNVG